MLAGDERRTAAAEVVENRLSLAGGVLDQIHQHLHRLHRGVDVVALRLVEIQQIALAAVGIPVVRRSRLPAVEARLALVVVVEPPQHETVLYPVERFVDFEVVSVRREPEIA